MRGVCLRQALCSALLQAQLATQAPNRLACCKGQGVFFLLWPLFARAPRHWFLENVLLSAPGVQSVFFVALRWAPRPFGGARAKKKKKHHPGCVFLLRPRGKAGEGEAPLGAGTAARAKKNTLGGVFFCSGPVPAPNGASPSPAFPRSRSKKNTLGGVSFCSGPRAGAQRGFSFPCLSPGPQQKKNTLFFFFFCSGPVPARGFSFPCLSPGPEQKKKHPGWCCFFAAAPRGRSLTHCGPGWRCLPLAGVVFFFFLLRPRPDRGGVFLFFAVAPPGRSLTHCGLGRFRQGPGGVSFLLRPRRVFLDNNKKCLGYYIGSKKTRRGHSKKKTPLPAASVFSVL